jgi:SAM-dependent methyltransferase
MIVSWSNSLMPFEFAAAYDQLNAADDDYRYYAALAARLDAGRVVDLGCGTGSLGVLLATVGCEVVGVDPDQDMLDVARSRPGGERVTWRQGYADALDSDWADLAVMSGHVAQVFVDDAEWRDVLAELRRGLRAGGGLAFETRNPTARGWERWTRRQTSRVVAGGEGEHEFWHELVSVDLPQVTYATYVRDLRTGEQSGDEETLTFRDEATLRADLQRAGFEVEHIHGDWDQSPVTSTSPELIVVATRA